MLLVLFMMISLLRSEATDYVEIGQMDNSSQSALFWIIRYSNWNGEPTPDNILDAPADVPVAYSCLSNVPDTKTYYNGRPLQMKIADLNSDGSDEGVILFLDDTNDENYPQVRFSVTGSFVSYNIHFSLREPNRLFVSNLDQEGSVDFIVGKIDGKEFKYQILLNNLLEEGNTENLTTLSLPVRFDIQEVFLIDGIGEDEGKYFLYLQGDNSYAVYIYDIGTSSFELLSYSSLGKGKEIIKSYTIQSTHSSFISSYNLVSIDSNNQMDFLLMSSSKEGLSSFKHCHLATPDTVDASYVLDEIYIPSHFENRLAIWYQSPDDESGQLVFFDAIEQDGYILLKQTNEANLEPLHLEYKPKIVKYRPSYILENQVQPGSSGRWYVFYHNNHYSYYGGYVQFVAYNEAPSA